MPFITFMLMRKDRKCPNEMSSCPYKPAPSSTSQARSFRMHNNSKHHDSRDPHPSSQNSTNNSGDPTPSHPHIRTPHPTNPPFPPSPLLRHSSTLPPRRLGIVCARPLAGSAIGLGRPRDPLRPLKSLHDVSSGIYGIRRTLRG